MIIEIPKGYKLVSLASKATHIMVVDHEDNYSFTHEFKKGEVYEFCETNNGIARGEQGKWNYTYCFTTYLYLVKQ